MQAKGQTAEKKPATPVKSIGKPVKICFVSLCDKRLIDGIDKITEILQEKQFIIDHYEYRIVKKSEIRRPINPKHKDGPREKVVVEERINVNATLKTLRQLEWRVIKDPENILLLQIGRMKGEALCMPLILPGIFAKDHQVLITGLTDQGRLQLLSKPDLKFQQVPEPVAKNPVLLEQLLQRASRSKGMQATARELLDFPGLPDHIAKKINSIATGKNDPLTSPEAVNLILLSDLITRYLPVLQTFQNDVLTKAGSVAQLSKQFAELTENVETGHLIARLGPYLGEEGTKATTNGQVFAHLYQRLQQMKDGKIFIKGQILDVKNLFNLLRSMICISRSQQDPELWERCFFFLMPFEDAALAKINLATLQRMMLNARKKILIQAVASSRSLIEIYCIHQISGFVIERHIRLGETQLPEIDRDLLRSAVLPRFHIKLVKNIQKKGSYELFNDPQLPPSKLLNPVHCVSGAYGYLLNTLVVKNLSRWLQQNTKTLQNRFGRHFFDIFYEQGILEPDLPVTRADFARWLTERQIVTKPETCGYIPGDADSNPEPQLTPQILLGSGQSSFPADYTVELFAQEFLAARREYVGFLDKIKKMSGGQPTGISPARDIMAYLQKGQYNLRSYSFRRHMQQTSLFAELQRIVADSLEEIRHELEAEVVNQKAILKIPAHLEAILWLGNTFLIEIGSQKIKIRLHVLPTKTLTEQHGLSEIFARNLDNALQQAETPERKGLIQAIRLLGEYQKVGRRFSRYLGLVTLDRIMACRLQELDKEICSPEALKHQYPDLQKLVIGNTRNTKLSKLFRFDQARGKSDQELIDSRSFAQMLETVMYWQSIKKDLEKRKQTMSQIIRMLGRFSKTLKKGEEWKTYSRMVKTFHQLISRPLDQFDPKTIKTISDLSFKLNRLVSKREYKDNAIAILYAEWKRKHPDDVKKIYFYIPFMEDETSTKSSLLLEIRRTSSIVRLLKSKKCIIFLPEAAKTIQLKQMVDIARFLDREAFNFHYYVETSGQDDIKINEICKNFFPKGLFQLEKLEPLIPKTG